MTNKLTLSPNQIFYGNKYNTYSQITDVGGKAVILRGSSRWVDSIQIGDMKYGGPRGDVMAEFTLPQNGVFTILDFATNSGYLGYFKLSVGDSIYTVGAETDDGHLQFNCSMNVKFAGIYWNPNELVRGIVFDVVS